MLCSYVCHFEAAETERTPVKDRQVLVGATHAPSLWSAVFRRGVHLDASSDGALRAECVFVQDDARREAGVQVRTRGRDIDTHAAALRQVR